MSTPPSGVIPDSPACTTASRHDPTARIREHFDRLVRLIEEIDPKEVAVLVDVLDAARRDERTVYTLGNGGSAATALHLANDLSRMTRDAEPPLRTLCLAGNVSTFSALANDFGYDQAFARQLESWVQPGDVVLAISGSGASPNCVEAVTRAHQRGASTLGLLGFDGGPLKPLCDHCVLVPSRDYPSLEDAHLAIGHALALGLADRMETS